MKAFAFGSIFMPRASRPISVTLGELQQGVESRMKSGACASASEVMRAALRALDREESAIADWPLRPPLEDGAVGRVSLDE